MVGKFAIAGVSFAAMVALGGGAFAQTTEPTPVTVTTVDYVYDAHGTPTEITKTTVGGGETHVSKVTNTVSNDEANWLIGRITQSVETRTTPDNTTASRTTAYSYHGNTHLIATETVEPGDATLEVVTQYGRDSFGNVTSQTVSTVGETARTASMIWSTDGRFMLSQTNGLNHTVAYEYNTALGTVTKETDANGLITAYEYDGFGRLTRQVNADGTEIVRSYDLCADITGCPVAALERIEEQHIVTATGDAVGPVVRTYLDELGRDFMMESQAADGTVTYQETVFDTFGRVIRKSRPYFAGDLPVWADTAYDVLDRVVMVTEENGAVTQTAYDGLTVTVTTPLLETESRQMDALGRLALVTDTMNGTVSYGYDAFGNLTSTTDAMGNVVQMFYDQLGNKTGMVDPDMGSWSYVYNGFGELVSQTDAKNQTVTLGYDVLGRMTQRVEAEGTSTWSYDTAANGIGMVDTVSGPGGQDALGAAQTYSESHSYDALGRPSATTRTIRNENYTTSLSYDAGSRLETVTYPTGFKVAYDYTATGYLNEITNDGTGASLWQAVERDAEGQVVSSDLGNGLTEYTDRDALGRVTGRTLSNGTLGIQLDLAMTYDIAGNLTVREDSVQNRHESFAYDALNRLSNTTLTDTEYSQEISQTSYQYDILGNITYKSDVTGGGAMTYGAGGRPHAVATARGGQTFSYDDNGNVLFDGDRNYAWTSFNKPSLVTKLTASTVTHTSFVYGPDRSRIRQKIVENSITKEVAYIGSYYERRTVVDGNGDTAGVDTHLHYIRADDASLAIHKIEIAQDTTQTEKTLWYSMDHIGSVVLTTDVIGNVSEAMSYDAHGARREATWESALLSIRPVDTPRGFTGHEHLDAVGIIHMNGRIYDPELGRMLSPDPNVPDPTITQEFNRYAYVRNNPLSYTDPTGFWTAQTHSESWGSFPGDGSSAFDRMAWDNHLAERNKNSSNQLAGGSRDVFVSGASGKDMLQRNVQLARAYSIGTQFLAGSYEYSIGSLVDFLNTPLDATLELAGVDFRFGGTPELMEYVGVEAPNSIEEQVARAGGQVIGGSLTLGLAELSAVTRFSQVPVPRMAIQTVNEVLEEGLSASIYRSAKGANNPAVRSALEKGRLAHKEFARKVSQKPGWQSEKTIIGPNGEKLRPDAITRAGRPVELKPNTPTGRRQGAKQIAKYKEATGANGRVVYYGD